MAEDCLADRYQILREIGRGGTSIVYLARDKKIQRIRAIKKIEKNKTEHMVIGYKEAAMLKSLQHPGVVELYDILEDEIAIYFIMEYVDGCTLKAWMAANPSRTGETAVAYGIQICEVLQYLHNREPPVIYRDLKPSNVMIRKNGRIVLLDFGSACQFESLEILPWGTPGYAAPEQLKTNGVIDVRTDIYSLGVILYEIASGGEKGSVFYEIVRKCTREDPDRRYQSIDRVKERLTQYPYLKRKKRKSRKYAMLLDSFFILMAIVCFGSARFLESEAVRIREEGYLQYLNAGTRSSEREYRIQSLQDAVCLAPEKGETYLLLLEELRSQGFDGSSYQCMMMVLNSTDENGIRYEEYLKEQEKEYQTFAYEMAVACYFEWEDGRNKRYALPWLTVAKEAGYLTKEERTLMSALARIAKDYDYVLGQYEEVVVDYRKYWEIVKNLTEINDHAGAEKLAKEEALAQIWMHLPEFQTAGITKEEVVKLMNQIRTAKNLPAEILERTEELIDLVYE